MKKVSTLLFLSVSIFACQGFFFRCVQPLKSPHSISISPRFIIFFFCCLCFMPCALWKTNHLEKICEMDQKSLRQRRKKSSYKYQQKFHPPQWFMFDGGKIFCLLKLFLLLPIKGSFISQRCRCQCKG